MGGMLTAVCGKVIRGDTDRLRKSRGAPSYGMTAAERGRRSHADKERLYVAAVALLDPYARQALDEMNAGLMLDTGEVVATGVRHWSDGDLEAVWALSWSAQRARHRADPHPRLLRGRGSCTRICRAAPTATGR